MDSIREIIISTTKEVINNMGFEVSVISWLENKYETEVLSIETNNSSGSLIGKQGANLDSLEHIIRLISFKKCLPETRLPSFVVDINGYRTAHLDSLISNAQEVARGVEQNRRTASLPPMTSYERRVVHSALASYSGISTESIGEEPDRRIMIKPNSEV